MLHIQLADEPASNLITDGDLVVVYERFDSLKAVRVDRRQIFNNKFGHFAMQVRGLTVRCRASMITISLLQSCRADSGRLLVVLG